MARIGAIERGSGDEQRLKRVFQSDVGAVVVLLIGAGTAVLGAATTVPGCAVTAPQDTALLQFGIGLKQAAVLNVEKAGQPEPYAARRPHRCRLPHSKGPKKVCP
jgi:hypothetical protein